MFRPTRLLTTYCAHTKQDQSVRFVPLLLYENSVLLNHKVLTTQTILPLPPPPLLSTHLTCDLHQHSEAITHGGAQTHTLPAGAPQGLDVTGSCQSPTLMQTAFFTQVRLSKHTLTLLQQESSASSFHITASLSQIYIYTLLLPTPPTHTLFFPWCCFHSDD